jgi:hypothetical protein
MSSRAKRGICPGSSDEGRFFVAALLRMTEGAQAVLFTPVILSDPSEASAKEEAKVLLGSAF